MINIPSDHRASVCALVPYPKNAAPSQRFRLEQWEPHLRSRGIRMDITPFATEQLMAVLHRPGNIFKKLLFLSIAFTRRAQQIARCGSYDAVILHRAACLAGPAVLERILAVIRRPIIFDFDDAIFLRHTTASNRRFGWLKCPGKTAAICKLSSHVVVGNKYLANYARRFNRNVSIIPTSIDTELYKVEPNRKRNPVLVVGWIGSSTSQTHLEQLQDTLRKVIPFETVELRIVSDQRPRLEGIPFDWHPWSAETEVQELSQFDIGIMPMPDEAWSRGKCAGKALQYMALGIPTICSSVGANRDVIQHGGNGFLAATEQDWAWAFRALIGDASLRRQIGTAARETVEKKYSAKSCGAAFADVIVRVVGKGRLN